MKSVWSGCKQVDLEGTRPGIGESVNPVPQFLHSYGLSELLYQEHTLDREAKGFHEVHGGKVNLLGR